MFEFVFRAHLRLALHGMVLFVVGLFVSWPIVHYRLEAVARLPLAVFRLVLRLMGASPSVGRTVSVIFCFNAAAIFLYMASGFHPLLPKTFAIWTGMNIGIIVGMARQEEAFVNACRPAAGQWVPPPALTSLCGLLLLVLVYRSELSFEDAVREIEGLQGVAQPQSHALVAWAEVGHKKRFCHAWTSLGRRTSSRWPKEKHRSADSGFRFTTVALIFPTFFSKSLM